MMNAAGKPRPLSNSTEKNRATSTVLPAQISKTPFLYTSKRGFAFLNRSHMRSCSTQP